MWKSMKKFLPSLLSGTSIFIIIAVSIICIGRYTKTVVGKLHTKMQNISEYSLRGLFNNVCYNFYTLIVSFLQRKEKMQKQLPLCSNVLSILQLLSIIFVSRYIFVMKQNFTRIEHDLYCQIFYITCRFILLIQIPSVSYYLSGLNSYTTSANYFCNASWGY